MGIYKITRFNCWAINLITRNCFIESQHSLVLVPFLYEQCHSGFNWVSHATSTRCKFLCSRTMKALGSCPNSCCTGNGNLSSGPQHPYEKQGMMAHTYNPSTRENEAGESLEFTGQLACWIGVIAVSYSEHMFNAPPYFPHAWFP